MKEVGREEGMFSEGWMTWVGDLEWITNIVPKVPYGHSGLTQRKPFIHLARLLHLRKWTKIAKEKEYWLSQRPKVWEISNIGPQLPKPPHDERRTGGNLFMEAEAEEYM